MAPIDGLIFAGYRSFDASADDPFRIKWNAVQPSLELPAGAEVPALTMAAIGAFNANINQRIIYTTEPDRDDAWQTPVQTLAISTRRLRRLCDPEIRDVASSRAALGLSAHRHWRDHIDRRQCAACMVRGVSGRRVARARQQVRSNHRRCGLCELASAGGDARCERRPVRPRIHYQ